jgi:hypothetical protein
VVLSSRVRGRAGFRPGKAVKPTRS